MLFNLQKKQWKNKQNYFQSVGLRYMEQELFQTQGMGQKRVSKPRDFCLMVTMTETGRGPRLPFLAWRPAGRESAIPILRLCIL